MMNTTALVIILLLLLSFDLKGGLMLLAGLVIGYVACLRGFDYKDYVTVSDNDIMIHTKHIINNEERELEK